MKRLLVLVGSVVMVAGISVVAQRAGRGAEPAAQAPAQGRGPAPGPNQSVPQVNGVPQIPFESVQGFFKITPDQNFGEVLSVAVNSKGNIVILNHPGTATSGPIYGNATTNLLEFDSTGKFIREIGKGVYGMAYGHSVRFDKYDNLWYVDKATNAVVKFNPQGYVTLNLGRRAEGYDSYDYKRTPAAEKRAGEGTYDGATDVSWDSQDNIYVSDGYVNSRIAKLDKNGNFIKSWGSYGMGDGQFRNPHNMQVDARSGTMYVADRGNGRIHVYDLDGNFKKFIWLNAEYDKKRHPTLAAVPLNAPNASAPWALCITNTPTQYLYAVDTDPGRLYKMSMDGKILGMLGGSGREVGQFNWPHGLACPSENTVFVADMNNWRVQKIVMKPAPAKSSAN